MKIPLFIAHGQEVLQVLAVIVAFSNVVAVAAVASALRKKQECVSRSGAVLGSVGILLGLWLCWLARWEFDSSLLSIGIACITPISALGLALSLRKRPISQPQTNALDLNSERSASP